MEKYIKENGKMENKTGKERFIFQKIMYGKREYGQMEKELNGLIIIINVN